MNGDILVDKPPLVDSRTIKMGELPQCPMGCEKKYLNLIRKRSLEDVNFSPTAVDFVCCTKCDFNAPIRQWKKLPGIYGGANVAVEEAVYDVRIADPSLELSNLRGRFWMLMEMLTSKGVINSADALKILEGPK